MPKFKVGEKIIYTETYTGNIQTILAIVKDRYVLEDKNNDIHCSTIKYIDGNCKKYNPIKIGDDYKRNDSGEYSRVINLFEFEGERFVVIKPVHAVVGSYLATYLLSAFARYYNYNP